MTMPEDFGRRVAAALATEVSSPILDVATLVRSEELIRENDLNHFVEYQGWMNKEKKIEAFRRADILF